MNTQNTPSALEALIQHQFPGATIQLADGVYYLLTIHAQGDTAQAAMENALSAYACMSREGKFLPQMLEDITTDLKETPGMTRERHDSLIELLTLAEGALNDGVLTDTVPWIMVPSYTRQIEDLRRKVSTRLMMIAQEMQARDEAKKRAATKFPHATINPADLTPYQRLRLENQIARAKEGGRGL